MYLLSREADLLNNLPINDSPVVQKLKSLQNTSDNELCRCFLEPPMIPQNRPNLSSQAGLQEQINELGVAVGTIQTTNEW